MTGQPDNESNQRAAELLAELSLDEKLAQLGCVRAEMLLDGDRFDPAKAQAHIPFGIGHVARLGGVSQLSPRQSATIANDIQRWIADRTPHGIPAVFHEEAAGGYSARDATVFPQALGQAASWNPELVAELAAVISEQMRAVGARHALAPVLDVARDPRWGRVEETYGEDPFLVATLGAAFVRGLQGADLNAGVVATAKHFIGYSMPEGGRNWAPVQLGPRELRDVYARPFATAIAVGGLASVMNSYSSVDGLPCGSARSLLTGLLRDELGFDGVVVSDYFAIDLLRTHQHVAQTKEQAARLALTAGIDMELPGTDCYGDPLRQELAADPSMQAVVDEAVSRVLSCKFRLGLFERRYVPAASSETAFDAARHLELTRRAAAESMVLLANDGVLPIAANVRRIAVLGPGADDQRLLQGDYHYPAHQEALYAHQGDADSAGASAAPSGRARWLEPPHYTHHVTPLAGLRALMNGDCQVVYAMGCGVTGDDSSGLAEGADAARHAELAIVVVAGRSGLQPSSTVGESRDSACLRLTGLQERLIEQVHATGTPTVVVVLSGRVHALERVAGSCNALLQAWPPGQEGGTALAEILLGRRTPSGKLPVTMPRNAGQIPLYATHRAGGSRSAWSGDYVDSPSAPLFSFGHGLSYTEFGYADMEVRAGSTTDPMRVTFSVTNLGTRPGTEVAQLYITDLEASVARPERQLVGFARVELRPGETRRVQMRVHPSVLAYHDEDLRLVLEPGRIRFEAGSSSADRRLTATAELDGEVASFAASEPVLTQVVVSPTVRRADAGQRAP